MNPLAEIFELLSLFCLNAVELLPNLEIMGLHVLYVIPWEFSPGVASVLAFGPLFPLVETVQELSEFSGSLSSIFRVLLK